MMIYVDADACPVRGVIECVAKEYNIPVTMICDVNHAIRSDYSSVIVTEQGSDNVDLVLINKVCKGDIVVSQDYGVATLALGKDAYAIGNSGLVYTNDNIDRLLFERFLGGKVRRSGSRGGRCANPKKRTAQDDENFKKAFELLCRTAQNSENR